MGITALPLMAEGNETSEFEPNGTPGGGFLTDMLNSSLEQAFEKQETKEEKPTLGRTLKDYVSAPKFGGYYIGKYDYSSADGANNGSGFSQRMIRAYVDGTILTDFKYRIQVQINNANFHVKDVFIEWARWKEFSVKLGQYKRAVTFENPYNPWDVGAGDYAQITRMIAGIGVTENGVANGGRDQGLKIHGYLFPAPSWPPDGDTKGFHSPGVWLPQLPSPSFFVLLSKHRQPGSQPPGRKFRGSFSRKLTGSKELTYIF